MLKIKVKGLFLSLACASGVFSGMAQAQSAGFGVSGTITPAPCTIALGGGGIAAYGSLLKSTVQAYPVAISAGITFYTMGTQSVPISLACTIATKVEISVVDNKAAQVTIVNDGGDVVRFGIGDGAGTTPAGHYSVYFTSYPTMDGASAAGYLNAPNGSTTWGQSMGTYTTDAAHFANGYTKGFIKSAGNTVPDSLANLSGTLIFDTYMLKSYVDAATSTIVMNGSGTMTLVYL